MRCHKESIRVRVFLNLETLEHSELIFKIYINNKKHNNKWVKVSFPFKLFKIELSKKCFIVQTNDLENTFTAK